MRDSRAEGDVRPFRFNACEARLCHIIAFVVECARGQPADRCFESHEIPIIAVIFARKTGVLGNDHLEAALFFQW